MPPYTSPIYKLRLSALGEDISSWGDPNLNNALYRIEEAGASVLPLTITGNRTLSADNFLANEYRRAALILNGAPAADFVITVPAISYIYRIVNRTGKQATIKTTGGTGAAVRVGQTTMVICDGVDCSAADPTLDQVKPPAADLPLNAKKITGLADGTANTDAATVGQHKVYTDGKFSALTLNMVGTATANYSLGGFKITNLANGTSATDAVNLQQLQSQVFNANLIAPGSAVGQVVLWNGTSYAAGALDLADADARTGVLPAANGGYDAAAVAAKADATRVAALEAGYVLRGTLTPTGATADFLSITDDDVMLAYNGVSGTAAAALNLSYSTDNGTNWTSLGAVSANISPAAASAYFGTTSVHGLRLGNIVSLARFQISSALIPFNFGYAASTQAGAQINALRLSWASGNFDAGTISLFGKR